MIEILNSWKTQPHQKAYFTLYDGPVFEIGDYKIYHQFHDCWLYTYKGVAFNQLAGLNKDHLKNVANRTRPEGQMGFLYDRAIEILDKKLVKT
jgi:hypothetical protein